MFSFQESWQELIPTEISAVNLMHHIHSNKSRGRLTKSVIKGGRLFNLIFLQESTLPQKNIMHIQTLLANRYVRHGYMLDYFMAYNFEVDKCALIGAWAAIGTNMVFSLNLDILRI